jgi:pyridoxamine 5'-phosphate oxidase
VAQLAPLPPGSMPLISKNLASLRTSYTKGVLLEESIPTDPIVLFSQWYTDHQLSCKGTYVSPQVTTLTTCDPLTCRPSARILLLKSFDDNGFVFYTNYNSRKAKEIAANKFASMTFYWDQRQVQVEGCIEKTSEAESDAYFFSRNINFQIEAWQSSGTLPLKSRQEQEELDASVRERFQSEPKMTRPLFWGTV